MIPLKVIDSKTIEFDGDKYILDEVSGEFTSVVETVFGSNNMVSMDVDVISGRYEIETDIKYLISEGYIEESWGVWRCRSKHSYGNGRHLRIKLIIFGDHTKIRSGEYIQAHLVPLYNKINNAISNAGNSGDHTLPLSRNFFTDTGRKLLPKWFRWCSPKNPYKVGTPLPHAFLFSDERLDLNQIITVLFLNKKDKERFIKEFYENG